MANRSVNALTLSGATASANGNDMDNHACRSAVAVVDITTISGSSPTATFTLEGKDEISGKYYTILATVAASTASTIVMRVDPGLTGSTNLIAADIMPKFWRVKWTAGGSVTNCTATVGVALVD